MLSSNPAILKLREYIRDHKFPNREDQELEHVIILIEEDDRVLLQLQELCKKQEAYIKYLESPKSDSDREKESE